MKALHRKLGKQKESLSPEMCAEIDRLGFERSWFQWVVDEEGLKFAAYCLSQRTKEASLFDKWYPRLAEFANTKRSQTPMPMSETLGLFDAATRRILEPKIVNAERVPCGGNFTAAIFTAPLHVLPFIVTQWPSNYRHPVFLTPSELTEWRQTYDAEEDDQESWWYVFQDWDAELNPSPDSYWLRDTKIECVSNLTPVLIVHGLCWGSLAGGHHAELWGVDISGQESFLQDLGEVTY